MKDDDELVIKRRPAGPQQVIEASQAQEPPKVGKHKEESPKAS
jgi:hypothetical protein